MPTLPMAQLPNDPVLVGFAIGTMLLSVLTGVNLLSMRRKGPLLPYEPRRPVPWTWAGVLLAAFYLLITLYSSLEPLRAFTLAASMLQQVLIVGGFLFVITFVSNATTRDLGLPDSADQLARDIFIGGVACLVALAPVHIEQILLMYALNPQQESSGHPLVKMVMSGSPNMGLLVITGLATVVIAPICEEITFRLLLQGWLEKFEDTRVGWREIAENPTADDETRVPEDDSDQSDHSSFAPLPPQRGIAGLPYGFFPIFVSALCFGLAHFGYGPEPVPIFMLGLALGLVYQRTHRIIPGIVAHALFNLFTMIMLWRMLYHAS